MNGYKATDKDGKCRGMEFKVGKTYTIKGELALCSNGYHFCQILMDVYNYYPKSTETRIFEIEASGKVLSEGDKSATDSIKIVRELNEKELLNFWINRTNSGNGNSGDSNSGNRNSGNRNSGNSNSGNRNSGDWNSGDSNSGYFNTDAPMYFFNQPTILKYSTELENKMRSLNVKPILTYITESNMTELEKKDHPYSKTTGGFLRKTDRYDWTQLTPADKEFILSLPNYDDEVFQKISNGVSLLPPKSVKVSHNGRNLKLILQKLKNLV